jgi:hypothetical protein
MNRANGNESLHEVIKKLSFDFKLQGGFALMLYGQRTGLKSLKSII